MLAGLGEANMSQKKRISLSAARLQRIRTLLQCPLRFVPAKKEELPQKLQCRDI